MSPFCQSPAAFGHEVSDIGGGVTWEFFTRNRSDPQDPDPASTSFLDPDFDILKEGGRETRVEAGLGV